MSTELRKEVDLNKGEKMDTRGGRGGEGGGGEMLAFEEHTTSGSKSNVCLRILREYLLIFLTLIGVILGFCVGFGVRSAHPTQSALTWIGLTGELWIRVLKLMILPLLISSVTAGAASLDPKSNGKISLIAFIFIITTNIIGSAVGIILALIMEPGTGVTPTGDSKETSLVETADIFTDLFRNLIPDNIIEVTFSQAQTKNEETFKMLNESYANSTMIRTLKKTVGKTSGTNLLGVIVSCTLIGISAGKAKEKTRPLIDLIVALETIFIQLVRWFIWVTPIGVFSLITVAVASITDITTIFQQLGVFVGLVVAGIALHQLIIMPLIFFVFTRRNPYPFFIAISKAWLIGFATTSTAVALPEMVLACEEGQHVERRVSRFVIPFCIALNSDGSALFISAAAMFIANMAGIHINAGEIIILGFLTAIVTLALPSVPSSSIVSLVMILTSLNIPTEGISLLFAVEWLLDRIRTTSNVLSHTFCTVVTNQLCKKDLTVSKYDAPENSTNL